MARRGDAGGFVKVPLLVGNTDHEAGLTTAITVAAGRKNPFGSTSSSPGAAMMGGVDASSLPAGLSSLLLKNFNLANLMDSFMSCGSATATSVRIKNNVPVWRYRYHGDWNNTSLGTGLYYSSDVPAVFGTTELRTGNVKDTPEEAKAIKGVAPLWSVQA